MICHFLAEVAFVDPSSRAIWSDMCIEPILTNPDELRMLRIRTVCVAEESLLEADLCL